MHAVRELSFDLFANLRGRIAREELEDRRHHVDQRDPATAAARSVQRVRFREHDGQRHPRAGVVDVVAVVEVEVVLAEALAVVGGEDEDEVLAEPLVAPPRRGARPARPGLGCPPRRGGGCGRSLLRSRGCGGSRRPSEGLRERCGGRRSGRAVRSSRSGSGSGPGSRDRSGARWRGRCGRERGDRCSAPTRRPGPPDGGSRRSGAPRRWWLRAVRVSAATS